MPTNVIMPQLGESVVEGTVSKWLKRDGDAVKEFEPLLEVNTDKVDTEVPAPAAGVVLKLYVAEGITVKAGTLLALIGRPGEAVPAEAGGAPTRAAAHAAPPPPSNFHPPGSGAKRDLGFISPVVARIADEHKIDLQLVKGTGQGGRITKKDVLDYLEEKDKEREKKKAAGELPPWERPGEGDLFRPPELQFAAGTPGQPAALAALPAPNLQPPTSAEESIPVVGMRKSIAEHMLRSKHTSPHVTSVFEVDMTRVLAHREANQAQFARDGVNLTLTAYFAAATVAGLKAVPIVNSQWAEDKILLKREVNIGVAVALDEGLIVPVIKNADEKSLLRLAREVNDLAQRARSKALKPDEVVGGTFTITNHGMGGSLFATPIIHQPQTAILGVGALQKRVVVIHDAIAIRPMLYLSVTFDHRVLDGAVGDRFLAKVKETLEQWG